MKLLLLYLFLLFQQSEKNDCAVFYKETLLKKEINGKYEKKKELDQYYILYITNNDNKNEQIKLLKNSIGKDIFLFFKEGSLIVKSKNELTIRILSPDSKGNYQGRRFEDLCE